MRDLKSRLKESISFFSGKVPTGPATAVILGSGLGAFADELGETISIPTVDIPHYPESTVPGHKGRWVFGKLAGVNVLAVQGRIHFYEGYSIQNVGYPVHLMANLGVRNLIVTTASGGINPTFSPGDLMLIVDHINIGFTNPLIGPSDEQLGPRFPDMSQPYDREFIGIAQKASIDLGISLQQGVFCWLLGPTYETAAEVSMIRRLGADAASMSTVPEVIVAKQRELRVLGISCITNLATGISQTKLSHDEVTETANRVRDTFNVLLREIIVRIAALSEGGHLEKNEQEG